MKERTWTIGSLPDCDIQVDSPTVSGRHCRLTQRGQTFVLEDLASTNGTFVAGRRIDGPRNIRRGDKIILGLSTPMPWPNLSSITVGRLPDNDVVIPLDMVSGRHARLERQGNQVFLLDLKSTNGTSLNDPLNRISRAAIQPGDVIFLGTHRIAAAELLAALPEDAPEPAQARQATRLEGSPLADLGAKFSPAAPMSETAGTPVSLLDSSKSARAWVIGIGLSAACALVVIAAASVFRAGAKADNPLANDRKTVLPAVSVPAKLSRPAEPEFDEQLVRGNDRTTEPPATAGDQRPRGAAAVSAPAKSSRPAEPKFDEQLVRRSENGVYMLCIRAGSLVAFMRSTAWAISPSAIVCPTDVLKHVEGMLTKGDKLDDCIVVCSPSKTLRIMKHSPADGEGAFLSVGRLEAPAETVSLDPRAAPEFVPEPGQKLAVLVAAGAPTPPGRPNDNPATISRRLIVLKVDRIQRDAKEVPLAWHCTAAEDPGPATAAPVFDGAGQVVGCVESTTNTDIRVVPMGRLATLQHISP
jgi:pSer/pThr/pTyr-binding forkhead associated (FHA) protein